MWGVLRFVLFVVGAFVLFGASAALYWEHFYAALHEDGAIVPATVTSVVVADAPAASASQHRDASVHFAFQTAAGKTVQSKRLVSAQRAKLFRVGAKINVRYLPTAPSVHEIVALSAAQHETGLGRWLQYLLLAFVGGGVMFWSSDTQRLRKARMNLSMDDLADAQTSAPDPATLAPTAMGAGISKRFR